MDTESLLYLVNLEEKVNKMAKNLEKLGGGDGFSKFKIKKFEGTIYNEGGTIFEFIGKFYIKRLEILFNVYTVDLTLEIDGVQFIINKWQTQNSKMFVLEDFFISDKIVLFYPSSGTWGFKVEGMLLYELKEV